ncbi:coiled-coil domain-containing protein 187 isoform X3 [Colius striatus]|uniref:coiled-coil domain-containing protein 187 isoform X3 n=1 Tax=Colius striatus TaxID=57412 RepID=UPI002B1DC08E|nr:coiled-coil domain-containing protein 187 isoform X3 [Colius striatus]
MDNSFASGESDPLADVALAWKSLQEAQAVLQRIENKFYHQTWSCAKSEAARRKLWHESSFDSKRNKDETALNENKRTEIPSAFRKGNCAAVSPAWSQSCFLEGPTVSSCAAQMNPLSPRADSSSAPADGKDTAGRWSPAKSLYGPGRDHFREQADSRGHIIQEEKSPSFLHHPPHFPAGSGLYAVVPYGSCSNAPVPMAVLLPAYHLSSASKPSDQKLEELWKKSPQNKLEQLKKRIQEQKQKQQAASQDQKCLISVYAKESLQKRSLKRKVCKVASAPPAPVYRDQRERSPPWRIQTQSQRQPSHRFSVLESTATSKGAKQPGASAWREEPSRGFTAMSVMENSSKEKGNETVGKSPEFKSCMIPPSNPHERGNKAATKDTTQILRNLHFQSQYHDEHRHTRLPKDNEKGKVEVLQQYLGIHSPSSGPRGIIPSAFSGEKIQSSLMKDGARPSTSGNSSRGKSISPQRQKGSNSPVQEESKKENLKHPSKRRVNIKKSHPYSPESVQEFMDRKKEERKKKSLEEKKSLVQATEMRNKRLQEVYRKQKEAIGKKTCSDQMCKLLGETPSAKESPQCQFEREQSSGRILERSFMAWMDKKACTLSSKDHRGSRNKLLETVESPKKREALTPPAPLVSESYLFSPLKFEDLYCSPPALQMTPFSFSPPQKDVKPYSKDPTPGLSPYRSKQDRVKAIHSLSKELAEKIEMATTRLNAASWVKDSADETLAETTLDLYNESSPVTEPETFKDEQDRTMTIQMLLDAPDPDVLCVSSDRISPVGRQKAAHLPGGSATSKDLLWIPHSTGQRHLSTGKDLSNTLQGFPVNKGAKVDISLLHEKPITSPASPSPRFLTQSLQRELMAQRNPYQWETTLKDQNELEMAKQPLRKSLRTLESLTLQPSATLSTGAETQDGSFEQDFVGKDPSCMELEEKYRSHLDNLRQSSLLLAHKLKVYQLQQQQQLTELREKANLEVQESQRFLSDLLQHNSEECSSSNGSCPSVPRSENLEQTWGGCPSEGDNAADSNQEMHSLKQPALKTERYHSPVDPKMAGERKPLGGRGSHCSVHQEGSLPTEHPPCNHQTLNLLSPLVNLPHGESCARDDSGESSELESSKSQWSKDGRHYGGSSTFCRFSLAMAEQCLRGEELRARHQAALLKLRKKALQEKAKAELAWLGHQKRYLENLQDSKGASAMAAKQRRIQMELKQEQAEIQHLQNLYRAAHQERKLLLRQQREILMMQHSTAQLQEKLYRLGGKQKVTKSQSLEVLHTRTPAAEEAIKLTSRRLVSSPKLYSSSAQSTAHSERHNLLGNKENCVQLKNKRSKKYEGFSSENKKTLVQYQNQVEESPDLEQSLDVQGPDVSEAVAKTVCGAISRTAGSVFMIHDCKTTELNAQNHVLLPLDYANSTGMDEPITTPIGREGRKCVFQESVLDEKSRISNPKIDPKDNEDINPCDSKFTAKGLGVLSTLCNLCLNKVENTLQGTGEATSPLKHLEKESLIAEKAHKEQRSPKTSRHEQDLCSPVQACDKKDLSSDGEDGERRYINEKASSESPLSEVKEAEVPVPYELHQVDSSEGLQHLDHISYEPSDEELHLKVFSEGLTPTESLSKSNNFSQRHESAKSNSSLPEFQKVSAACIDISESAISDSILELENGEDTDVSAPEEFVYDNDGAFPNASREMLIALSNGKETLPSDKHDEHEVPTDDSTETSPHSQKYPGDDSDRCCTDNLLAFIPSEKTNASKTESADSSQADSPARGMDEPQLDASENYSRNKTSSQEITKQGKDVAASSSCSDDIYSPEIYEQQKPSSTTSRVKKNGGIDSLFVDQNRDPMEFLLACSLKHTDLVSDELRNTVSFPPDKDITNKLLPCLSPRNLSVSGGENNHAQVLNERLAPSKLSKIVSLSTSMPGVSEEAHTETNSSESLQRVATGNQSNSPIERQAMKKERSGLFPSVSTGKQLFHPENCSSKGEDETLFISDEGPNPTDEHTLSEILSPVDEVLSYGSADLPSSNKKDLSLPSEDLLPSPPLGADAIKNYDSAFSMGDFPSLPEEMTVSETGHYEDEDSSLQIEVLPPLPGNTVPEEFPLVKQETAFSTQDGNLSEQFLVKGISSVKEDLLKYQQGEHETPLQHLEFLPLSNPISSGQATECPDFPMKQCKTLLTLPKAEEDNDDPLLSFEIGDRVLVKQTQPGTLMFKGWTCFDSGYWAGVALDKAEGDNDGTYKGVKYFESAQHCGIFVRPDEISHLLGANENGSNYSGDEDSDSSCDDEFFKGDCKYSEDSERGRGFTEQKAEDKNSAGGSEVKGKQSRLHTALLSGRGQKLPHSYQCKCNEFLHQNNSMSMGSDKEKTELSQIKQRIPAHVLPVKSKTSNTDEVNTSKTICCLVEDQKRNKLADDIVSELSRKVLFDTLIAFSETAQHKYKSAFEKDMMNYGKGLRQKDNQKLFLLKDNSIAILSEQSTKASDVLLCDFDMLSIHGCHTAAERIVTKFVDDAVNEYKKIKRKHGSKAEKIFNSSSETSTTWPFLVKILDAGIFGSSDDFDHPNSDQYTLVRQPQKQHLYKLDQWHSAPWKKTVEAPLVIPHYSSYVKKLSACAVEELWTPENIYSNFRRINVPKHLEYNDLPGKALETESMRMYNQVILDLTRELLCGEYQVTANPNTFPWVKENLRSHCSRHFCRRTDVSDVKTFVQGEITKIMNLEKNDLAMKRKLLNMTKYGNCKRDRVDLILIQELRKEEPQWTCYDDDELTVKMQVTEDIFDSLILDTIRVLNKIYLRKASD